jgi:hypothetical protein
MMAHNIHWDEELISSDHQIMTDDLCFTGSITKGSVMAITEQLGFSKDSNHHGYYAPTQHWR